ncbi:SCO family protein [Cytobacillus sp. IB215316]|uniref:SCO family protein n=1 Tax=Cytobacillus sp. IB215316 TaxID=3097354 RepID=UPI0039B72E8E
MTKKYLVLITMSLLFILAGCGNAESDKAAIPNQVEYLVEDFTFTDQKGEPFGLNDLEGKVWVADFIFTNCTTVCSPMTANMARLQRMLEEEEIEGIEFVSFSVDPEVDAPEILEEYGTKFDANFDNWHFLTGYEQGFIEEFAKSNFKTLVQKPTNQDQVIHGTDFYLVDQTGTIIKYYSGITDTPYDEIVSHIKVLQ